MQGAYVRQIDGNVGLIERPKSLLSRRHDNRADEIFGGRETFVPSLLVR